MTGGRVRDYILGGLALVACATAPIYAEASTNTLPVPRAVIQNDYGLRSRIGLHESLFDGVIDASKKNYELAEEGVTVTYEGNNPSIDVYVKTDDDTIVKSPCSFKDNVPAFSNLVDYLRSKARKAERNQDVATKNWANKWSAGFSKIGPMLSYWHSWEVNNNTEGTFNVDVTPSYGEATIAFEERTEKKSRRGEVSAAYGEDINDEKFKRIVTEYQTYDLKKNTGEIWVIGQRYSSGDSELLAKYGFAQTGDFARAFSVYYDQEVGAKVYLGLLTANADPNEANQALIEQISDYSKRSPTGNHPILSDDILLQLALGIEGDHLNAEVLANLYDRVGVFSGIGSYWHNYDPYVGAAINLGENWPIFVFSISQNDYFIDVKTPRFGFNELIDKVEDIY
jgi:hypothetical protein